MAQIEGDESYIWVRGTGNNDDIYNSGNKVTIDGFSGNDRIFNHGDNVTIDGGTGKDTIYNWGNNTTIYGSTEQDRIDNSGSNVTISGGQGNDFIELSWHSQNHLIQYEVGDGNDIIYGFKLDSTLQISGGSYSTQASGDDIIVTVGKGKISLIGAATLSSVNIIGTKGNSDNATLLTVTDSTSSPVTVGSAIKTINASKRTKAVKITGNALANSIVGGSGNDSLYGGSGNDTILGNAGNDKLYGQAGNDYLSGGAGNDSLAGGAGNNTLNGGDGNDVFIYGGGNDLITDYAAGDKIKISSGTISKATVSGNDVVFTIGTGKLTVTGGKQKTLTLINSAGVESQTVLGASTSLTVTNSTKSPVTVGAAIKTINASKRTKAVKITGNKLANSISGGSKNDTLYGGKGNDTILGNVGNDKLYGEAGNDYLLGGKGNDTLSGDKGNDTLTGGAGNDVFIYSAGNDLITDFAAGDTLSISSGTVSEVTASGDNLIFKIGTGKITLAGGANETVTYCDSDGEHTYPDTSSDVSISGKTIKLLEDYMEDSFNVADYGAKLQTIDASAVLFGINITGNKLMNSIIGSDDNDTLIGGKGNDTLTGGEGADVFVYSTGDGQDTITDYTADDIISIGSGTISDISVSGKDVVFKVGSGKITVKNAKNKVISYVDASGNPATYPQTVIISGTTARLTESYMNDSFNAADYNSSLRTIDATAVLHDLEILGNKLANSIIGSENNETISGGKGNDTLTGGDGSDIFVYNSGDGNDVITDYAEEDRIKIASGTASVTKKNKDVIFTVGSEKITVKGAATKTVTYIDKSGKTKYFPKPPESDIILTDDNKTAILRETYSDSTYTAGSSIIKIDASSVTRDLTITGNSNANIILGGSEDDTIYGSKGHDTLQGGSGADVFVYANGDGNDRIVDYSEDDTIKITKGTIKNKKTSGDDVIFTIGSGKITVLGAASKTVSYIEGDKKKTYGSASNVLEDDNFITGNDLSAIVNSKAVDYAFAQASSSLALNSKNNLLSTTAYSSKK